MPREKVLAAVVRLLELTFIRVGNEEYARLNRSFGLTTLRNRHVDVHGTRVRFRFRAKSGKLSEVGIWDRRLAALVRRVHDLPGQELFEYVDVEGEVASVSSEDVNGYLRDVTGADVTAKDVRTWAGTVLAYRALSSARRGRSATDARRHVLDAINEVAAHLGNTPAVSRKSYVHPDVVDAYLEGSIGLEAGGRDDDRKPGLRPGNGAAMDQAPEADKADDITSEASGLEPADERAVLRLLRRRRDEQAAAPSL